MPFSQRRSGMILGSGGIGMVLESEEGARRRYEMAVANMRVDGGARAMYPANTRAAPFRCRLLGTLVSNSAYHGASMDRKHIAEEVGRSGVVLCCVVLCCGFVLWFCVVLCDVVMLL
jgi:3-oxoacyl-(acyl-carrier-protein) synthase